MAVDGSTTRRRPLALAAAVLPAVLIAAAVLVLLVQGDGRVRPSADSALTVPVWHQWLPPLAGVAALLLAPPATPRVPSPAAPLAPGTRREAGWLALLAVLLPAGLLLTGADEPAVTGLKLALLVAVPTFLLRRSRFVLPPAGVGRPGGWPLLPVAVWALVAYATPLAPWHHAPREPLAPAVVLGALVLGFVGNAVVEEVFYRRWLQSRLETLLGAGAAVLWATVLWSVWHAGIQSVGGGLPMDLAAVVARHAPGGIFLGLLWLRYRRMWPLLAVHGAINAVPLVVG